MLASWISCLLAFWIACLPVCWHSGFPANLHMLRDRFFCNFLQRCFNTMLSYKNGLHIFNCVFPFRMETVSHFFSCSNWTRNFGCASLLDFLFSRGLACQFAGFLVCWHYGMLVCWHSSILALSDMALFQPLFLRVWVKFLDRVFGL